jgi:hypothetical protein
MMGSVVECPDVSIILHPRCKLWFALRTEAGGDHPDLGSDQKGEAMMRGMLGLRFLGIQIALVQALACTPIPPHPKTDSTDRSFSSGVARAHLASLDGLYPRLPGSRGDSIARAYLEREFRLAGASVRELAEGDRQHLVAEIEGDSNDVLLLVAAYPVLESGVWIDDSGAVLLLELARVFGAGRPPPYRLVFALAETHPVVIPAGDSIDTDAIWQPILTPADARQSVSEAGHSLARGITAEGGMGRTRAVIAFETSSRAGLRIARDLRSHPGFRKVFWETASDLGFSASFPSDGDWASPESLQLGFRDRSMDRVLALVDEAAASADAAAARTWVDDSPGSFDSVGIVTVEALSRLMHRLEKVDAFSR